MSSPLTRREILRAGAAGGAAAGVSALLSNSLIARALAQPSGCESLREIQHVVILVQENRSFDHYFGSYRGVTGFADPAVRRLDDGSGLSIFAQPGYPGGYRGGHLYPFHLDSYHNGECTNDINHSWGPQHNYWDGGKLDSFVRGHLAVDGSANAPLTMGYYTRDDLRFYYALADAFTICDRYFCSVIGPTDPNRLYTMSAWLDPAGTQGGPILSTSSTRVERYGTLSWTTMPEQLQARGISWKVYGGADGNFGDNVLPHFKQYQSNPVLAANALVPSYPGTFQAGFRVPLLVVSPFSRGGFVCKQTFDHTSLLRFLETRFGAGVPNLSAWRRSTTGDLTAAFNFAKVNASVPPLPQPSATDSRITMSSCASSAPLSLATDSTTTLKALEQTLVAPYPVAVNTAPPRQEAGTAPAPSGPVACRRT